MKVKRSKITSNVSYEYSIFSTLKKHNFLVLSTQYRTINYNKKFVSNKTNKNWSHKNCNKLNCSLLIN